MQVRAFQVQQRQFREILIADIDILEIRHVVPAHEQLLEHRERRQESTHLLPIYLAVDNNKRFQILEHIHRSHAFNNRIRVEASQVTRVHIRVTLAHKHGIHQWTNPIRGNRETE